jgi:hypothetical protein
MVLSPKQQIRLHFRCLVREHRFRTLGWHLKGIRRALSLSELRDIFEKSKTLAPLDPEPHLRFRGR